MQIKGANLFEKPSKSRRVLRAGKPKCQRGKVDVEQQLPV